MAGSHPKLEGTGSTARQTAAELLPLVYAELRRLATFRLAQEKPGQTLQPTALVHEAWLRLANQKDRRFADPTHFYCAAATAMRRILIDHARQKARIKHGGLLERVDLSETGLISPEKPEDLLALDEALERFSVLEPQAARLVELRYFGGMTHHEAGHALGISRGVADELWSYARAWLLAELLREPGQTSVPPGSGET